jgi:hypothetical protein
MKNSKEQIIQLNNKDYTPGHRKLLELLGGKIIYPETDFLKQKTTILTFFITPGKKPFDWY